MSQQFPLWGAQSRPKPRTAVVNSKTRSKRTQPSKKVSKRLERSIGDRLALAIRHAKGLEKSERDLEQTEHALRQRLDKESEDMVQCWRQHNIFEDSGDGPQFTLLYKPPSFLFSTPTPSSTKYNLSSATRVKPKSKFFVNDTFSSSKPTKGPLSPSLSTLAPIFQIPGRIRYKVYQYLNIRDRIACQLVCRQMRNEVRRYAGIVANVSENCTWGPSFMRDIICETIRVRRFQQPRLTPIQLLYKRLFVKHLCFVGSIPHQFVDAFAARCPNIQRMSVYSQVTEKMLFPKHPFLRKQLDSWRMKETISRFPRRLCHVWQLYLGPPVKVAPQTIPLMLRMFRFPHLKRLIIKLDDFLPINDAKEIHLAVFDALQNRLYHIRELIIKTVITPEESRFRGHLYLHRPTDVIIKASQGRQLYRFTFTEPVLDYQLWGLFLCEQRRLQTMQFLQLVQFPVYLYVIPRNRNTLVTIGIHVILWFRKNIPMKLDLALFGLCPSLKELFIHVKAPFIPGYSDVFNFKRLPKGLETLGIYNCMCQAKDLIAVGKLPHLKSFGVSMVKKPDLLDYCLNCHSLRKILRSRSLDELYLNGFCLSKYGAVNAHRLGALCGALTRGYTNMFYMRHPDEELSRWFEVPEEKKFVFKMIQNWGFDLAHTQPPRCAEC